MKSLKISALICSIALILGMFSGCSFGNKVPQEMATQLTTAVDAKTGELDAKMSIQIKKAYVDGVLEVPDAAAEYSMEDLYFDKEGNIDLQVTAVGSFDRDAKEYDITLGVAGMKIPLVVLQKEAYIGFTDLLTYVAKQSGDADPESAAMLDMLDAMLGNAKYIKLDSTETLTEDMPEIKLDSIDFDNLATKYPKSVKKNGPVYVLTFPKAEVEAFIDEVIAEALKDAPDTVEAIKKKGGTVQLKCTPGDTIIVEFLFASQGIMNLEIRAAVTPKSVKISAPPETQVLDLSGLFGEFTMDEFSDGSSAMGNSEVGTYTPGDYAVTAYEVIDVNPQTHTFDTVDKDNVAFKVLSESVAEELYKLPRQKPTKEAFEEFYPKLGEILHEVGGFNPEPTYVDWNADFGYGYISWEANIQDTYSEIVFSYGDTWSLDIDCNVPLGSHQVAIPHMLELTKKMTGVELSEDMVTDGLIKAQEIHDAGEPMGIFNIYSGDGEVMVGFHYVQWDPADEVTLTITTTRTIFT